MQNRPYVEREKVKFNLTKLHPLRLGARAHRHLQRWFLLAFGLRIMPRARFGAIFSEAITQTSQSPFRKKILSKGRLVYLTKQNFSFRQCRLQLLDYSFRNLRAVAQVKTNECRQPFNSIAIF